MRTTTHAVQAAALALAIAAPVLACDRENHTMQEMVAESDLIFRGVVQDIQYALSSPGGAEQAQIPHTFVTYRVDHVLQGAEPGASVTLRFIGGFDARSLSFMGASIVPEFDLGDEDVLFVAGNGQQMCPLVGSQKGRVRLVDGQAYSDTGRALLIGDDGELKRGTRYLLPEVLSTTVLGRTFERKFEDEAIAPKGNSPALAAAALVDWIGELADPIVPPAVFQSADAGLPFEGPDMTAVAPPAVADEAQAPAEELAPNDVEMPAEVAPRREKKSARRRPKVRDLFTTTHSIPTPCPGEIR